MRRLLSSVLSVSSLLAVAACADSPTAPSATVEAPSGPPNEVVATSGTLVQLGVLTGFANGGVYAINNAGVTAGWNNTGAGAYSAFVRATDGTMTKIDSLGGKGSVGLAINNSNSVVGLSYLTGNTTYHAFLSTVTNGVRNPTKDLGALVPTAKSAAYGINGTGTVVGFSYNALGQQRAVRWAPPNYVIQDLGTLGGTTSFAYDVNDGGTVVGFSTTSTGQTRAFKYSGTTMTNLGGIAGGTMSVAHGINTGGDIVGWATTSAGDTHAWGYYAAQNASFDMGSTGGPSYAYDINDSQQAVGWALPSAGNNAALAWLATLTPKDLGTLSNATNAQAYAINGSGQVVGLSGTSATMWFLKTNTVPTASIGGPYAAASKNQTVHFDASGSKDADGDILNYAWDFGDAASQPNNYTATGVKPTHVYLAKGTFTVKLTVTDWRGGAAPVQQTSIVIH